MGLFLRPLPEIANFGSWVFRDRFPFFFITMDPIGICTSFQWVVQWVSRILILNIVILYTCTSSCGIIPLLFVEESVSCHIFVLQGFFGIHIISLTILVKAMKN